MEIEGSVNTMEKGKFLIDVLAWKKTPKSRRRARALEEREGYIEMTEEQKETINGMHDIGIYIGYDEVLKPEMYEKQVYKAKDYKVVACTGKPTPLYKIIDTDGNIVKECKSQVEATMWVSRQSK